MNGTGSISTPTKRDDEQAVKRSIRYLRVGSKRQMDTDADIDPDGNSIDTQRKVTVTKERALGTVNVGEYIEPGNSAQSIEKRPEFQKMLNRIIEQRDVDYVVIYMRSRAFRNYIDAAIVKRQLEKLGVKLISAKEDFGEGPWADAMEAITDVFNDVQVKLNGQDISIKMLNKAQNGGTNGRAKLGYLNASKIVDGHKVNTIAIDPDRNQLVTSAFELFATGEYTAESLHERLVDAGLTIPTTGRPVSIQTVQKMLRDPYYVGRLVYKGIEYPNGRHQPLVSEETFDRVQRILDSHSGSGVRYRTHPHYLKGLLWCDRCKHRFTVQRAQGRQGGIYYYFLCRGRQDGLCNQPYVAVEVIAEAVADHYALAVWLPEDFRAEIRAGVESAVASDFTLTDQMRDAFAKRLATIDRKESYLLDLAAEEGWPKELLREKVGALRKERGSIRRQLDDTQQQLETGRQVFLRALELLDNPQAMYRRGDESVRSILNRAFFTKLYIDGKKITGHELKEPFDVLQAAYEGYRAYQSKGATGYKRKAPAAPYNATAVAKMLDGKATARGKRTTAQAAEDSDSAAFLTEGGTVADRETLIGLLRSTLEVKGWSKTVMVDLVCTFQKRQDLADQLRRRVRRLTGQDQSSVEDRRLSVRTTAKAVVPKQVADRLGEARVRELIEARQAGARLLDLAERYGISESSVKRLIKTDHTNN